LFPDTLVLPPSIFRCPSTLTLIPSDKAVPKPFFVTVAAEINRAAPKTDRR
jgi:hypothetical protein